MEFGLIDTLEQPNYYIYEVCFCHELSKRGLRYQRQVNAPIVYDGITFDEGLRLDIIVEDFIICELKAVDEMNQQTPFTERS